MLYVGQIITSGRSAMQMLHMNKQLRAEIKNNSKTHGHIYMTDRKKISRKVCQSTSF